MILKNVAPNGQNGRLSIGAPSKLAGCSARPTVITRNITKTIKKSKTYVTFLIICTISAANADEAQYEFGFGGSPDSYAYDFDRPVSFLSINYGF